MKFKLTSITTQIFLGMVLGVLFGSVEFLQPVALKSQILSDIFLRLICRNFSDMGSIVQTRDTSVPMFESR